MTTTTLAIVDGPTLRDGLVTLLRIGEAMHAGPTGVTVYTDETGHALEVEPDPELPGGVIEYVRRVPVEDPWTGKGTIVRRVDPEAVAERRRVVELLAGLSYADLLVTSDRIEWL